jgi:hypothetical protein
VGFGEADEEEASFAASEGFLKGAVDVRVEPDGPRAALEFVTR